MSNFGFPFRFPADVHEKAVWLEKLGLKEFTETVSKFDNTKRKSSTDSTDTAPGTNCSEIIEILNKSEQIALAVVDLSTSDFSTPRKARRNFRSMKQTVLGQKNKIKTLQQSVRRLRSKATNLNSLINHLKSVYIRINI
ncbi:hypothetical protein JTB14_012452 [Gonioctena quinquepunctata]|nr:hypothetical protein JTB14_012452 [Gonioctena quinquepunctata]